MKIQNISSASRGERGIALLYAIFGAFAAAGMVSVMLAMGGVTSDQAAIKRDRMQGQYLVEGAIEFARKDIQTSLANFGRPRRNGAVEIDGIQVPYTVTPTGIVSMRTSPEGIQTEVEGFEVRAEVDVGGANIEAYRLINGESTPIFQYAVFYTEDLEILPGPDMTLGGRVHSNGDMYLGSGGTLTMDTNYVRSVGRMYRSRKNETASSGDVMIRKWVENPFDGSEPSEFFRMDSQGQLRDDYGLDVVSGYDSNFSEFYDHDGSGTYNDGDLLPFLRGALEFWSEPENYGTEGYTVLTGEHGVKESVAPDIESIKLYQEQPGGDFVEDPSNPGTYIPAGTPGSGTHDPGYFYSQSDLKIVVEADGSWAGYDGQGNDITSDLVAAHVIEITDILDTRQSNSTNEGLPVAKVDLQALKDMQPNFWPANGLMYVGHQGMSTGTGAKGVQLVNGSELKTALTTVSEGSVYIEGDFNTINKVGAAVIGDAVNLLSNDWDGNKSANSTLPRAGETTFNVAIITGTQETVGNSYNGGLENLPRFHENWTGVSCNISGSFVNPWENDWADGGWRYGGDRYKAPGRNWNYDPDFNNVANLPPFTPMAVSAEDVVSW